MKKPFNFRKLLQITFFVLIALISVNHTLVENDINIPLLSSASLHALCPYGGVETFVALVAGGTFIKKVHESAIVLLAIILFLGVLFGPVFCSYVCPLGSLQEWLGKLGKKIFPKRYNKFVPKKVDKYLRYLRYVSLILTVYLSTMSLKLVFESYDPYYALFNFWSGEVAISALIVLGLVIVSSLFIERAWCKYACPFGALLGITNLFRVFKIRRETSTCTSCNLCSKNCPMNIDVAKKEVVKDHQCISCGICTSEKACPVDDTVTLSGARFKKNINVKTVAITIIAVLVLGIGIGKLTDTFITESRKVPQKISSGEFAGAYDPADIRGSYSFEDVSNSFDIPIDVLAKAFNINTKDNGSFELKNLEEMFESVGTSSVREFVALYTGLPYEDESDGLPVSAIEVLLENGKIIEEEYNKLITKYSKLDEEILSEDEFIEEEQVESEEEHSLINNTTSVKDALDIGIPMEDIERILGVKITDENMLIKDLAKDNGLRFSEVKDELNALVE